MFSLNRVVVVLAPLVFAPAAAFATAWLARNFPGVPAPSASRIVVLEGLAFTGAVGMAAHWLRGHQKWNEIVAGLIRDGSLGAAVDVGFVPAKTTAAADLAQPTLSLAAADQPPILAAPPQTPAGEPQIDVSSPGDAVPAAPAPRDPTKPSS